MSPSLSTLLFSLWIFPGALVVNELLFFMQADVLLMEKIKKAFSAKMNEIRAEVGNVCLSL